jgi:hypothetical protein
VRRRVPPRAHLNGARTTRLLTVGIVAAGLLFVASVGWSTWRTRDDIDRNQQALTALCVLRADQDKRIESAEQFLRDYPKGIPGIPIAVIQSSLANSRRTRKALDNLDCKEEP